jgi:prolyl-tRNA synthetase
VPQRVVISDRGLKEGLVELQGRRDAQADKVSVTEVARRLHERLAPAA